ncbi:hypothetical protein D3C71_1815230 [compost metagenome]
MPIVSAAIKVADTIRRLALCLRNHLLKNGTISSTAVENRKDGIIPAPPIYSRYIFRIRYNGSTFLYPPNNATRINGT